MRRDLNLDSGSGSRPSSRSSSRSASPAPNKKAELLSAEGGSTSGTPTPGTPTIHKSASKYTSFMPYINCLNLVEMIVYEDLYEQ